MKTFIAIETDGGHTELPNKFGDLITVNNCQMLMKSVANDVDEFRRMLCDYMDGQDIDVDVLQVTIYEIDGIKSHYN